VTAAEPVRPGGWLARTSGWVLSHVPTREGIEANRFLRPVAHRILAPALWRFTHRSVPRGVALGIFAGILFPLAHMPLAAVLALPFRANVPVAVGTALINNPITVAPIFAAAFSIGHWILRLDHTVPGHPIATNVNANAGWLHWVVTQAGPATIVGLLVMSVSLAAIGYVTTSLIWRFRIARKWRNRRN
jgi:uncharacterized protein (DUF2062 family)